MPGYVLVRENPPGYTKLKADIVYAWRGQGEGMNYEILLFRFSLNVDTVVKMLSQGLKQ